MESGELFDFTFTKFDLLTYSKWTKSERDYINAQTEVFKFTTLLIDFHNHFSSILRIVRSQLIIDSGSDLIKLYPQMIEALEFAHQAGLTSAIPFGPTHLRLVRRYIAAFHLSHK